MPRFTMPKITYNAPVTLSFTGLCLLATVLSVLTNGASNDVLFSVYRDSLLNPLTYVRLVTHVFGHIGFDHFIGNAMLLLLLGPMLEEKYGSSAMVKTMVATALVTGLAHCLFNVDSSLCGASGVAFAFIILSSLTSFERGEIPLSFILVAVLYLGSEVYDGIFLVDSVSNLAHILGGVVGAIAGSLLRKRSRATGDISL